MLKTTTFYRRGCVGEGTKTAVAHCSVELKRIVTERGRRSRGGHLCFV